MADPRPSRRRRRFGAAVVVARRRRARGGHLDRRHARTRNRNEEAALVAANHTSRDAPPPGGGHAVRQGRDGRATRNSLQASIASTMSQLATTNGSLANTNVHAYVQGVGIDTLQTCLGGVKSAFGQIAAKNNTQAAKDISAVSGACTQLAGGTSTGLVYPFDFPDPYVILVGQTYYAYATNSVAGNIQIIESTDLVPLDGGRERPAEPARLGVGQLHLGSCGGPDRRELRPLLRRRRGGAAGRSASPWRPPRQPQGPFTDRSTAPLECQKSVGGSIDPGFLHRHRRDALPACGSPVVRARRKSGPSNSTPSGTSFSPGASPTSLLVPDQPWEAGTVEAPNLVTTGGHYYLFFSGNDWDSANYAVGVATCTRPARSVQRCHAEPDPVERARGVGTRRRVGVRRHGRELLDRVPRLGPGRGGVPQQPGPLPPPALVLRRGPDGGDVRLGAARRHGRGRRPARHASAGRGQRFGPSGDPRRIQSRRTPPRSHSSVPANAGRPPFVSSERSMRKRRQLLEELRLVAALLQRRRQFGGAPHRDIPVTRVGRDVFDVAPPGEHGGGRLGAPPGSPGKPSALSPTSAR